MNAPKLIESAFADAPDVLKGASAAWKVGTEAASAMLDDVANTLRTGRSQSEMISSNWRPPSTFRIRLASEDGTLESISPAEFRQTFGVTYAQKLRFDRNFGRMADPEKMAEVPAESRRTELERDFADTLGFQAQLNYPMPVLDWLYGKQVRDGAAADVYLRKVNETVGYGAFAASNIRAGQFVGEYTGLAKEWQYLPHNRFLFDTEPGLKIIDAQDFGNFTRFINHSYKHSNVQPAIVDFDGAKHIIFVAKKPIERDRQLLFNYGKGYWQKGPAPQEIEP